MGESMIVFMPRDFVVVWVIGIVRSALIVERPRRDESVQGVSLETCFPKC